jgi:hypothetical protein
MSRVIVFGGPSLPLLPYPPCVDLRAPAQRGDLSLLTSESCNAVVLLDGTFFHKPAPTHRDILRLLQSGVLTVGAASMGALRAAELRDYGMVGVGVVYQAVLAGVVTDDSELAVGFSPYDFAATTIPLINVRRLLALACQEGLDAFDALQAFDIARQMYFLTRTRELLQRSWSRLPGRAGHQLTQLLADERMDLKRSDANLAIEYALSRLTGNTAQPPEATTDLSREIWYTQSGITGFGCPETSRPPEQQPGRPDLRPDRPANDWPLS